MTQFQRKYNNLVANAHAYDIPLKSPGGKPEEKRVEDSGEEDYENEFENDEYENDEYENDDYENDYEDDEEDERAMREDEVLKAILERESLIHTLSKYAAMSQTSPQEADHHLKNRDITSILLELKGASIVVVEAIEAWRNAGAAPPGSNNNPLEGSLAWQPFIWNGINYLLKMTNDIDFLASIETLVAALGRHAASLRHNPLMTQHNLDSIPLDRLKGRKCDSEEEERVRKAERVILEEMRWANHARGLTTKQTKKTGAPVSSSQARLRVDVMDDVVYDSRQKLEPIEYSGYSKRPVSIVSWRQQARDQLRDLAVSRAMDTALHASTVAARKTLTDPHANRMVPQLPPYLEIHRPYALTTWKQWSILPLLTTPTPRRHYAVLHCGDHLCELQARMVLKTTLKRFAPRQGRIV